MNYCCPVLTCAANPERKCRTCGYVEAGTSCGHPKWRDKFRMAMQPYEAMAEFLKEVTRCPLHEIAETIKEALEDISDEEWAKIHAEQNYQSNRGWSRRKRKEARYVK